MYDFGLRAALLTPSSMLAEDLTLPNVNLPLSGPVAQAFRLWTSLFNTFGNQIGLINVSVGKSPAPGIEEEVLSEVASYGRQLGRMGDALVVLLKYANLPEPERRANDDFKRMLTDIADVKERHDAKLVLRP